MKWKVAICGLGAAARQIHIPAYRKLSDVEVVGGCDPTVKEGDFSFPLFDSMDEMIEKASPDILAIVTPTATHFELTKTGLQAGCHVLCEKPFMSSMEEAREIVELAEQAGKFVVVNNQYRFMNIHEVAKNSIGTPEFGDLLFMSANQTFYLSEQTEDGWRGTDSQRTCKEFGIHVLDLARYYFGEDPVSISARMPKGKNPDSPDYLNLIQLEFSGDRVAHIVLDRLSRGPHRYLDIRLDGSEGVVETSFGGKIEFHAGIKGGSRKPYLEADISMGGRARLYRGEKYKKLASDPLDVFAHATHKLVAAFIHALETGSTPPCNGADNMRTLALVYAAYESSEKNTPVTMQYQ
jgi:predicted dehydrogenase